VSEIACLPVCCTGDVERQGKGKGKGVPLHVVKAYAGSSGIDPLILNLGTRWRRVSNFTHRPLYTPGDTSGTH